MAACLVINLVANRASAVEFAASRHTFAVIAQYVLVPSMAVVVVSGLIALAATLPRQVDLAHSVLSLAEGVNDLLIAYLAEELPGPVFRLDADTADAGAMLAAFQAADRGILVGTQVVAKGHDFPDVELGVVVDADATLRFPDFRAEERTFALVTQLAGRAGRGSADGHVMVQTIAPDARSLQHAARHDADGFLDGELLRREALRYPPFSTLIRVVCGAPDAADAHGAAAAVRARWHCVVRRPSCASRSRSLPS